MTIFSKNGTINQELSLEDMEQINGGSLWRVLASFGKAVIEGAKEIQTTQETGTLPDRFMTPITDVSGNSGGGSPDSSECTLNNGDYGRQY